MIASGLKTSQYLDNGVPWALANNCMSLFLYFTA
jgi:hypothetical protein